MNKSASGRKRGSNVQIGSSINAHAGRITVERDFWVGGKSGNGDTRASGSDKKIDKSKYAERGAALTKFHRKKERWSGNKVRNQKQEETSRKLMHFLLLIMKMLQKGLVLEMCCHHH